MTKCQTCGGPLDERSAAGDCKFCMKDAGDPAYQDVGERVSGYGKDPIKISPLSNNFTRIIITDFGEGISEETKQALRDIDKNTRYAIMNAHKMWCD